MQVVDSENAKGHIPQWSRDNRNRIRRSEMKVTMVPSKIPGVNVWCDDEILDIRDGCMLLMLMMVEGDRSHCKNGFYLGGDEH